jgi:hypothetical protein
MTGGMYDTSLARSGGLWDKERGLHVWFGTMYHMQHHAILTSTTMIVSLLKIDASEIACRDLIRATFARRALHEF